MFRLWYPQGNYIAAWLQKGCNRHPQSAGNRGEGQPKFGRKQKKPEIWWRYHWRVSRPLLCLPDPKVVPSTRPRQSGLPLGVHICVCTAVLTREHELTAQPSLGYSCVLRIIYSCHVAAKKTEKQPNRKKLPFCCMCHRALALLKGGSACPLPLPLLERTGCWDRMLKLLTCAVL